MKGVAIVKVASGFVVFRCEIVPVCEQIEQSRVVSDRESCYGDVLGQQVRAMLEEEDA